jgi:formiminoglutamase
MKNNTQQYWTGRKTNPALGNQYWYQAIQCIDINDITTIENKDQALFALLGYACDEGVRRNLGRVGAKIGPIAIREKLAKLAFHVNDKKIIDLGDIVCEGEAMEDCQNAFATCISQCIEANIFPIGLGGGHDMAYAHFIGIYNAIKNKTNRRIGVINFDAHFDLRPVEAKGNSGTPFNQILAVMKQLGETVNYLPIGIQVPSNTKELFAMAQQKGVDFVPIEDCDGSDEKLKGLKEKLAAFIASNDYIYISIDLDGFSSAYAMGVSAPSPLGYTPQFFLKVLTILMASNKVIACDIAELNPNYDQDGLTANLAARLVDYIVSLK